MLWAKEQQDWKSKLLLVKDLPVSKFLFKNSEWILGKEWRELAEHSSSKNGAPSQGERGLRLSFPLKLGVGVGSGRIDGSSVTLQLLQIKIGSDTLFQENVIRQKEYSQELIRKVETAGNVINAASVLLLSRAFCGPVISLAMACLATLKFSHFAIRQILNFANNGMDAQNGGLPIRVSDFSTASLLLSIGVPILKFRLPEIYSTLECLGAAIPVALGYAQTSAQVKSAQFGHSNAGENLWRKRHRWAARRLHGYLSDFRHPPTIGWLVDTWEKSTLMAYPNGSYDKPGFMFSIPLPVILPSKPYAVEKRVSIKENYSSRQAFEIRSSSEGVEVQTTLQTTHQTGTPQEDANGLHLLSDGDVGSSNLYLEISPMPKGWKLFQQRFSLVLRGCYLLMVFGPLLTFGLLVYFISTLMVLTWALKLRRVVWWLLRFSLEKGGAAFIKWGQWSATREDLFPEDLCLYLGRLHDRAPEHSYSETRKAVLENLGRPIEDIFEKFPQKPWASGSIAQVYKAKLRDCREGMPIEVAVKVRHPSVALRIHQDFQIMSLLATWAQVLPALRWLKLRESVDQFSHTLTAQADLRVEARNLARFHHNFETLDRIIIFPKLIPGLISAGVIVESFEQGHALSKFLKNRTALNVKIAAAGVDTYLKMLLTDNFLHTDLHPGNILARTAGNQRSGQQHIQLVLLDFGLAEELTPTVRYHFLSFIMMIGAGNGERAAHHLLQFSWPHEQTCTNSYLLVKDMKNLFARECNLERSTIDLNKVLIKVLQLCRKHEVTIDSAYASLVVAVCVLVGFARSLDPELSIMDAAVPCLFLYNLTGRIMGGIYG